MDPASAAVSLESSLESLRGLLAGVDAALACYRPSPEQWSISEIVGHLLDEEREDFRVRLAATLRSFDEPWPPIDPVCRVRDRGYLTQPVAPLLEALVAERQRSLEWLRSLDTIDLAAEHEAHWGAIRAGDLLASWVVHDWLHIAQITRVHLAWRKAWAEPFNVEYAF